MVRQYEKILFDYKFEQWGQYSAKETFMQIIMEMFFNIAKGYSFIYLLFFTNLINYFLNPLKDIISVTIIEIVCQ